MQTIKKNILYSILFGFVMEFQINVILAGRPLNMIGVVLLYGLLGFLTYYTFPFIQKRFASARRGFWAALLIHGLLGLFIIEWIIYKHTLGSIPDVFLGTLSQLGMFSWWATIATMPFLLQHPLGMKYKRSIFILYSVYAVISTTGALVFGIAPVILLEPPVFLSFFYFYRKFAKSLL